MEMFLRKSILKETFDWFRLFPGGSTKEFFFADESDRREIPWAISTRNKNTTFFGAVALLAAMLLLTSANVAAQGAGTVSLGVMTDKAKLDIMAGPRPLLMGIYPGVVTNGAALSVADGSLTTGVILESGLEKDSAGDYVTSSVYFKDVVGKVQLGLLVTMYPDLNAAAVSVADSGKLSPRPDGGLVVTIGSIPGFEKGMAAEKFKPWWTRPAFIDSISALPADTQFLLWRDGAAGYAAMAPLVGGGLKSVFEGDGEKLLVKMSSLDAGFRPKNAPAFAVAWGDDPYDAIRRLYRVVFAMTGDRGRPRESKGFPDIFEKIGWCSWNAFYKDVDSRKIIQSAKAFRDADFPVGFFLVDDGWQRTEGSFLAGLGADEKKFPGGVGALASILKNEYKIPKVGFWHAYQGYWDGVQPGSELADKYSENLLMSLSGALVPDPVKKRGYRFFYDYHQQLRRSGADFVKVDNQSAIAPYSLNRLPIGNAASGWQRNLQDSVDVNFGGSVINCMCMAVENLYFWNSSNVSRSSDDYFPDVEGNPRRHAVDNIYNSLWYSELTYPDFDMFQSHHPQAAYHAALRAVSGGPIYITDTPGRQDWPLLWKLVYSDGTILRPDIPARPTRDMLFRDPFAEAAPLKTFTRTGDSGVIALFNARDGGGDVAGALSPSDVEGIKGNEFIVYEHFSGRVQKLSLDGRIRVALPEYGVQIYSIIPVSCGVVPIGLIDKFISYHAVEKFSSDGSSAKIRLRDGGVFAAYMEKAPVSASLNGVILASDKWVFDDNLLRIPIPSGSAVEIEINTGDCGCAE